MGEPETLPDHTTRAALVVALGTDYGEHSGAKLPGSGCPIKDAYNFARDNASNSDLVENVRQRCIACRGFSREWKDRSKPWLMFSKLVTQINSLNVALDAELVTMLLKHADQADLEESEYVVAPTFPLLDDDMPLWVLAREGIHFVRAMPKRLPTAEVEYQVSREDEVIETGTEMFEQYDFFNTLVIMGFQGVFTAEQLTAHPMFAENGFPEHLPITHLLKNVQIELSALIEKLETAEQQAKRVGTLLSNEARRSLIHAMVAVQLRLYVQKSPHGKHWDRPLMTGKQAIENAYSILNRAGTRPNYGQLRQDAPAFWKAILPNLG